MLTMVSGGTKSSLPTIRASSGTHLHVQEDNGQWDWPERYKPTTLKELAMGVNHTYPKKVRAWIEKALRAHAESRDDPGFKPHVLALCGISGCGKSTMVEVLCREMKVKVMEWSEDAWDMDLKGKYTVGRREHFVRNNYNYSAYGDSDANKFEPRLDEVNDLELFVRQSAYPQLSLSSSSSSYSSSSSSTRGGGAVAVMHPRKRAKGTSKALSSTMLGNDSDFEFDDSLSAKSGGRGGGVGKGKRKLGDQPRDGGEDGEHGVRIVLMHDLPHLMASYSNARSGGTSFGANSVGDTRSAEKSEALAELLPSFRDPVIMIVSDVSERDDVEFAKRRFMPEKTRNRVELETIYQNKATDLNISKALNRILDLPENKSTKKMLKERLAAARPRCTIQAFLEELASSCLGDLRHAVLQLSFISAVQDAEVMTVEEGEQDDSDDRMVEEKAGNADSAVVDLTQGDNSDDAQSMDSANISCERGRSKARRPAVDLKEGRERDVSYSSLHSIGKIANAPLDSTGYFPFDVDTVLANSTMETEMVFAFLQQNVVKSLINSQTCERHGLALQDMERDTNELEQVVKALGYCSDIDMFIHRKYDPSSLHERSNNIYPGCYVSSLLARLGGVSRAAGSKERMEAGKSRGARKELTLVERPKSLDLRSRKHNMLSAFEALNVERFREARSGPSAAMAVIAPAEMATSMAPLMSAMLDFRHSQVEKLQWQTQLSAAAVYGVPPSSSSSASFPVVAEGGMMSERLKRRVHMFRELAGLRALGNKHRGAMDRDEEEMGEEREEEGQGEAMSVQGDDIEDSD